MFKTNTVFALIILIIVFTACASNEIGDSKDVAQDKIYQSYAINYSEGNTNVEVYCQFRFAGQHGTTLVLNNPSQVQFDGVKIKADSSAGAGAYYQTYRAANGFTGNHIITYITTDNKKLDNSFSFASFKWAVINNTASKKKDLNLNFEGPTLQGEDYIEVTTSNTDSSFSITHTAGDKSNMVTIPESELKRQKVKEISFDATLYRNIPLQQSTSEGGRLIIRYSLKPLKIKLTE